MSDNEPDIIRLFKRDRGRCVYCGLDLRADFDRFMMATKDHLNPKAKGESSKGLQNLILSCRGCNSMKADFTPPAPLDHVKQRKEYITAVRAHIMAKRAGRMGQFIKVTHPGLADYQ